MKANRLLTIVLVLVLSLQLSAQEMSAGKSNVVASSSIFIDAPIDEVWALVAEDFAGIGKWSSGVSHSQGFGAPVGNSSFSIRACEITAAGFDDTKEEILEFDSDAHLLRYSLYEGLPGFVKKAENIWKLEEKDGGTYVTGTTAMRATGFFGFTMKGMMKGATKKALNSMTNEMKYYIEQGKPHPDKIASQKKVERKDLKKRSKMASFTVSYDIQAPLEDVWKVVAEDFQYVYRSNPNCYHSEFVEGHKEVRENSKRIMYMSENRKKYLVDNLAEWDLENKHLTIEVIEAKGFPIEAGYTWVNFDLEDIGKEKTRLQIRFNYLTKPAFLKWIAKGSLKKQFQDYAWAIDHHVKTGVEISPANWKEIRKAYK